jgi:cyclophilin family peptidyl-prolyl cis-trans isomerase
MPSDKRSRQRAQRQEKVAHQERRRRRARRVRGGVIALVVAGIVVAVIVAVSGGSSPKKSATSTTTTSSTTTTTAKAAVAPTCPPATAAGAPTRVISFTKEPPICIHRGVHYQATVKTDVGTFVISFLPTAQLRAVDNFVFLARYHFFDGIVFQRVIPGFVVQGGDPTGTGRGGPGYDWTGNAPPSSCSAAGNCYAPYEVAYANSATPTSNESQFFIILPGGQRELSPDYTLFGTVTSGRSVVARIGHDGTASGVPKVEHHMISVTIQTVP